MRIGKLHIKNFKLFENISFEFNSRFTLIIGNNGAGKTSILEAISIALGGFLSGLDGVQSRQINVDEIRRDWDIVGDASVSREPQLPVEIHSEGTLNHQEISWTRTRDKVAGGRMSRTGAKDIIDYAHFLQSRIRSKDNDIILPIISFQSAGRLFSQKKNKWIDPFEREGASRFVGYTDCLEAESNIKLLVSWLKKMTSIQLQTNKSIGELEAVQRAVNEFMTSMLDEEDTVNLYFDFVEGEVIVQTSKQSIPLRTMSAGYRSIIGMVADIAYRMSILNPHLKNQAVKQTPGVVLIDELDLHLHPQWQWNIVESLKRTFPNVQFIATTHAPIVISTCKDGEVIDLHQMVGHVINEKAPYGWLVDNVLTDKMNTWTRDRQVQREIETLELLLSKQHRGLLSDNEQTQLDEIIKYLYQILPEGDPAVTLSKIRVAVKTSTEAESYD